MSMTYFKTVKLLKVGSKVDFGNLFSIAFYKLKALKSVWNRVYSNLLGEIWLDDLRKLNYRLLIGGLEVMASCWESKGLGFEP